MAVKERLLEEAERSMHRWKGLRCPRPPRLRLPATDAPQSEGAGREGGETGQDAGGKETGRAHVAGRQESRGCGRFGIQPLGEIESRLEQVRQFYRKLEETKEWAENNYYHLLIAQQNAEPGRRQRILGGLREAPCLGRGREAVPQQPLHRRAAQLYRDDVRDVALGLPFRRGDMPQIPTAPSSRSRPPARRSSSTARSTKPRSATTRRRSSSARTISSTTTATSSAPERGSTSSSMANSSPVPSTDVRSSPRTRPPASRSSSCWCRCRAGQFPY